MTDTQVEDLRSINTQLQQSVTDLRAEVLQLRDGYAEAVGNLQTARAHQREAEQELVNFKRRCTERMHREADRRQWCSEYDDIMEEMGLERRSRSWDVEFEIVCRVSRQILARDGDTARRLAFEELQVTNGESYHLGGEYVYVSDINILECDESS